MMALLENGPIVMAEIIMAWQMAKQAQEQGKTEEEIRTKRSADMVIPVMNDVSDGGSSSRSSGLKGSESLQSLGEDESSNKEAPTPRKAKKQNSSRFVAEESSKSKSKGSISRKEKGSKKESKKSKK